MLSYKNLENWTLSNIIQQYCFLRQSDERNPNQRVSGDWLAAALELHIQKAKPQFLPQEDTTKRLSAELFFYKHDFTVRKVLAKAIYACYDPKQEYKSLVSEK